MQSTALDMIISHWYKWYLSKSTTHSSQQIRQWKTEQQCNYETSNSDKRDKTYIKNKSQTTSLPIFQNYI